MTRALIVTGTDTGIGKTVVSAMLTAALDGIYHKPVQAGLDEETDTDAVRRMADLPADRVVPEAYRLNTPCSPHRSAELDGVAIDLDRLVLPAVDRLLIVEGAGGLLVPLTREVVYADMFRRWGVPVVLCARTALGTINHSLMSVEALRARGIPLLGIVFVGDEIADTERTIVEFAGIKRLGRLPFLTPPDRDSLAAAFANDFDAADFTA